jgi:hypothetical protein
MAPYYVKIKNVFVAILDYRYFDFLAWQFLFLNSIRTTTYQKMRIFQSVVVL